MALLLLLPLAAACATAAYGGAPLPPPSSRPVFSAGSAVPSVPMDDGPYPVGVMTVPLQRVSSTTGQPRLLETVIWYPAAESSRGQWPDGRLRGRVNAPVAADGAPFPVVVFSHGAGSSPIQSTFLTAHLASYGFVVAAPPHPGATWDDCLGCFSAEQQRAMINDSAANRPGDVSFTLDQLDRMRIDPNSAFYGRLDTRRAGAIGHSWGGYTAVMVAASDARFEAVVAMAPVVNETLEAAVQQLRSPVLVMGGRLDDITPFPWQERLFTRLPSEIPRYLLTFPLGGHTAYSETCPPEAPGCRPGELAEGAYPLVKAYTVAFLRVYLLGDARYSLLLNATVGGADVEWASGKP